MSTADFGDFFNGESHEEINKRIRVYRKALRNREDDRNLPSPDIIEELVNYCLENGKNIEAYEFSKLWIEYFPFSSEAWLKKSISQYQLDMLDNALSSLERAESLNPSEIEVYLTRADIFEELGELNNAEEAVRKALSIDHNNEDALLILGSILQKKTKYEDAVKIYDYLATIDEFKKESLRELAFCYQVLGEYPKSIDAYKAAIDEDPYDKTLWFNLGIIYYNNEQYSHAVDAFDMALVIKEDFFKALYNKGCALTDLGKLAESIDCFNEALKLRPGDPYVTQLLAGAYADSGDYIDAIELYSFVIEKRPYHFQGYFGRGMCYDAIEQFDKAISDYERALEFNNNIVELWQVKGDAHYNKEENFDAIECYKKVIELDPFNYECMYDLGGLYYEIQQFDRAQEILLELISVAPNQSAAYFMLGQVYAIKGDVESSAEYFSKAIQLDIQYEEKFYSEVKAMEKIPFSRIKKRLVQIINNPF